MLIQLVDPPQTEQELLARTEVLVGQTLGEAFGEIPPSPPLQRGEAVRKIQRGEAVQSILSEIEKLSSVEQSFRMAPPFLKGGAGGIFPKYHKGSIGQAFEQILGANAGNASMPDFQHLGIELKTLPIGKNGHPCESTFVSVISLTQIGKETWQTSSVYRKLKRVLWIPIEGDTQIPLSERRIGQIFVWSPDVQQMQVLESDWQEFSDRIVLGQLETISAKDGMYLQIRPKAADGQSLSWGIDEQGRKIKTLPRGFYLRASFTTELYLKFT